jgi:hypothetical protein
MVEPTLWNEDAMEVQQSVSTSFISLGKIALVPLRRATPQRRRPKSTASTRAVVSAAGQSRTMGKNGTLCSRSR